MSAADWAIGALSIGTMRDRCLPDVWPFTVIAALAAPPCGSVTRPCLHVLWRHVPIQLMVPLVR